MRWFGKESRRKPFGKGLPFNDSRQLSPDSEEQYAVTPDRRTDHGDELYSDVRRNNKLQAESDLQRKAPARQAPPRATGAQPDLLSFDEGPDSDPKHRLGQETDSSSEAALSTSDPPEPTENLINI